MKTLWLVFIGTVLLSVSIPFLALAQGTGITCSKEQGVGASVQYVCSIVDGMDKPGNCEIDIAATVNQLRCSGEPNGYQCTVSGTSYACDIATLICQASASGYNCTLPISGQPPSGCSASGGGIQCSTVPQGYAIDRSAPSPTSVSPTSDTPTSPTLTNTNPNCPPDTPAGQLCYTPLEPFAGLEQAQSGTGNLRELIQGFFRLLINVGAFVAVTVLVIGGITYMVSEATVTKYAAKEKIKAAFWGIAILAGAWLILNTINPQLLMFSETLVGPASGSSQSGSGGVNNAITYFCYSGPSKTSTLLRSEIMTDAQAKTSAGRAKINTFTTQCPGLVDTGRGTLTR